MKNCLFGIKKNCSLTIIFLCLCYILPLAWSKWIQFCHKCQWLCYVPSKVKNSCEFLHQYYIWLWMVFIDKNCSKWFMCCLILDVKIKNKISIGANSTGIIESKSSKSTKSRNLSHGEWGLLRSRWLKFWWWKFHFSWHLSFLKKKSFELYKGSKNNK